MKRRVVTVPVPSIPVSVSFIGLIFCLAVIANDIPHWLHSVISCVIWAPSLWNVYGGVRRIGYNNEPITLAVGTEQPEALPEPETRRPLAFPPEDNQCFVCGNYDQHRQEVFGDASHATCREWLGDTWPMPSWNIYYREYNQRAISRSIYVSGGGFYRTNLATLPGTTTRQQLIDHCNKDPMMIRYLPKGLTAELVMFDGGQTIKFDIPKPQEPTDPELAEAFYNNEGMTADEWLVDQYRKSISEEDPT